MAKQDERKLHVLREDAAGIDVGSREHWVAVPADRDAQCVQKFGTTTSELNRLAAWLDACGVSTVAMESTGVYWVPLYEVLEARGVEVMLVNATHVRNVPGRKSDVKDCQWIQRLHSYGLLRASFRPSADIVELRTYARHRQALVEGAAREVQHMQKALMLMNVQIHHAVNDITGVTGMRILRDIAGGQASPAELAKHRDPRCHATPEELEKALTGTYKVDQLFVLQQALRLYDIYQAQIIECTGRIEAKLAALTSSSRPEAEHADPPRPESAPTATASRSARRPRRAQKHKPLDHVLPTIVQVAGVDLTTIPGIAPLTALNLIAEIGLDMAPWRTEKHFSSWLNLAPGTTKTGGHLKTGRRPMAKNRAGELLRQSAVSVGRTRTALGAFYRRIAATGSKAKAVVATARKLAVLVYRLISRGQGYVDVGLERYERQYTERRLSALEKQAKSLGYALSPLTEAAPAIT